MKRTFARSTFLLAGVTALQLFAVACSAPPEAQPQAVAPAMTGRVAHRDSDLGTPTFVWIDAQPTPNADATTVAWQTLREMAPSWGLDSEALQATRLNSLHDIGRGAIIAQFEQQVAGLEVFRLGINVAMSRELQPMGATGYLAPHVRPLTTEFALDADSAVAQAIAAMTGSTVQPAGNQDGQAGYRLHTISAFTAAGTRYRAASPPRSKKVWFPTAKGLVPAYYIELDLSINDQPDSALHSYVVAANDGKILFDNDMIQYDSYKYRVFADTGPGFIPWDGPHGNAFTPHPTGKRDNTELTFKLPQLVTLANAPFSKNDPWLPVGATEATGNNATAYADIAAPDGYSTGDVMLKPSAAGEFDYSIDVTKDDPAADSRTIQAVTANFFYIVNYQHDIYYDAGWNEVARNPQKDNFMRGGVANDPIKAESQDNSGRNNANASTPADGASPRIQMYLFDPAEDALHVTAPADLARTYGVGRAAFGPKLYDLKNDLVIVSDSTSPTTDGCETPFVNAAAIKDKIAVIDRGLCFFELKAYNAQINGAKGVIIINNAPGAPGAMAAGSTPPPTPVTIPALMVSQEDGALIRAKLMAGTTVTVSMRTTMSNNDSSLDAMIVSHEWGHVLSNRLIGNANGLGNNQGRSMGEGWSDFVALLLTTRAEDALVASNPNWNGVFAAASYSTGPGNNSAYEGIRRFPYSSDMTKNPLTFRHIQNGVLLPAAPPPAFGADGASNAEVHNTGEIWSNVLWECYTALLRDSTRLTFAQASQRMREYLVAGLKLTPINPTILEARDAILLAALARDNADFELFARAFAKRGMGVFAVSPARNSADHAGVVESFAVGGVPTLDSMTLNDKVRSCDNDGILDNGETGVLTVRLKNTGTLTFTASASVTTESPYVTFPRGRGLTFSTTTPFKSATGSIVVGLKGAPVDHVFDLQVSITADNLAVPGIVTLRRHFNGNYDVVMASSDSDSMYDSKTVWTPAGDTSLDTSEPWVQLNDDAFGRWSIPDHSGSSDQYLISPALQVKSSGNFGFSVRHRYSMEYDTDSVTHVSTYYDGAVIELSADNGVTWTDIGKSLTTNGYPGTVWTLNDVLFDRKAFVGPSPGYPAFITSTADLGAAYQGKSVKLRFRVGTDDSVGAPGWDLDNLQVSGIDNTPFPSHQASLSCGF